MRHSGAPASDQEKDDDRETLVHTVTTCPCHEPRLSSPFSNGRPATRSEFVGPHWPGGVSRSTHGVADIIRATESAEPTADRRRIAASKVSSGVCCLRNSRSSLREWREIAENPRCSPRQPTRCGSGRDGTAPVSIRIRRSLLPAGRPRNRGAGLADGTDEQRAPAAGRASAAGAECL